LNANDVASEADLAPLEDALTACLAQHISPASWGQLLARVIARHPKPEAVLHALAQTLGATKAATLLAEKALAEDWNDPEEDAAWAYLQPKK